eukprot:g1038.t1
MELIDGLWVKKKPAAGAASASTSGKAQQQTHWNCPQCENRNLWKRLKCGKCAAPRPAAVEKPAATKSAAPKDDRSDFMRRIEGAATSSGSGGAHAAAAPRRPWRCPECKTDNAFERATCGICKARKPDNAEFVDVEALKRKREQDWESRQEKLQVDASDRLAGEEEKSPSDDHAHSAVLAEEGTTAAVLERDRRPNETGVSAGSAPEWCGEDLPGGRDVDGSAGTEVAKKPPRKVPVYLPKAALAPVADARELWRKAKAPAGDRLEDGTEIKAVMSRKTKEDKRELDEFRRARREDARRADDEYVIDDFGRKRRKARVTKIALLAASNPPSYVYDVLEKGLPYWNKFVEVLSVVVPNLAFAWQKCSEWYAMLPVEIAMCLYGLAMCFFGGTYVVAIAAIEAFKMSGGDKISACWNDVCEEYVVLQAENEKDDVEDLDNDGIADVLQISKRELMQRKLNLVVSSIDPDKVTTALGGLYHGFLSVLMTVKFQFAQSIALAVSMAETARKPCAVVLTPILASALPPDSEDWIVAFIDYLTKTIALMFAWTLQKIVCAVQSAIKGGHIFAQNLLYFLANKLGVENIDLDTTMVDEYIGWAVAAVGIYFQLIHGFSLIFPFSLVLLPLDVIEFALEWVVTFLG